jgi:hypothetical protein
MSAQLHQQTLSFTKRGTVLPNSPGPRPKAPSTALSTSVATALVSGSKRRRRLIGGINEAEAIAAFKSSRAHFDIGEPDSSGSSGSEDGDLYKVSKKKRRIAYSREKKLQAITYITSTNMPKKRGSLGEIVPISLTYASSQSRLIGIYYVNRETQKRRS